MRRTARWAGWSLLVIAGTGLAVWIVRRTQWDAPISVLGAFILVVPLYGAWIWLVHNRGVLLDRTDEGTDVADRALATADTALNSVTELWDWLDAATRFRPAVPPSNARDTPRPSTDTNHVGIAAQRGAQRAPEGRTMPHSVDLIGGARRPTGATASGMGRHAAPDTDDRQAGAQ